MSLRGVQVRRARLPTAARPKSARCGKSRRSHRASAPRLRRRAPAGLNLSRIPGERHRMARRQARRRRMPTMPQNAAGIRIEQPKSVPCAIGTMPAATATAEPPEEPAGLRCRIPRIAGRAEQRVVGVGAAGEFRRVGLGEHDGAGGFQAAHRFGVLRRHIVLVQRRAEGGADAGRRRDVLDRRSAGRAVRRAARCSSRRLRRACAASRACSAASVTMALSFGLSASITARWASSTSTGLTRALRMSHASSTRRSCVRRLMSAMVGFRYLPDQCTKRRSTSEEQQIETIAERAGGEYRRIHARHVEQLLRLEHAMAEAVLRADEHLGHHDDDQRQRHAVAQADEGLRQRFQQHHVEQHAQRAKRPSPWPRAAASCARS